MAGKASAAILLMTGLILVCLPTPGESLKCYVCNSMFNKSCDSLQGNEYLVDCNQMDGKLNYTNCRKEVFSAESVAFKMETYRVIRSCGIERHHRHSCFYSSNIDLKGSTCECTEDGCNAAHQQPPFQTFLLPTSLIAILAKQMIT